MNTFLRKYRERYYTTKCAVYPVTPHKCLLGAAKHGNLKTFDTAVEKHPRLDENVYFAALRIATKYGHMDIVDRILEIVGSNTKSYDAILKSAARVGNNDLIQLMIQKGAKTINEGLNIAADAGNLDTVRFLLENNASGLGKALESAAKKGYYDVVELLLEQGAGNLDRSAKLAEKLGYRDIDALIRTYML